MTMPLLVSIFQYKFTSCSFMLTCKCSSGRKTWLKKYFYFVCINSFYWSKLENIIWRVEKEEPFPPSLSLSPPHAFISNISWEVGSWYETLLVLVGETYLEFIGAFWAHHLKEEDVFNNVVGKRYNSFFYNLFFHLNKIFI